MRLAERLRQVALRLLPRGFNQQVAALSALSLVVALTVFGYVIYQKQKTLQEESATAQAGIVIRNFAAAAYRDILLANYDEIRELLVHTAEFPEVRRLVVTDNQGRIISEVHHAAGQPPEERFDQREMTPPASGARETIHRDGDLYEIWHPVADQGWVFMQYDYSAQSARSLAVLRAEIGTGLLLAIFSALYFLGLLHRPIDQLRRLIAFAQGLDVYQERREIHVRSFTREITELNEALNQSASRLFEQSQKILRSEAQYRRVVNSVREVIFQTDMQGRWTFLNPAWEEITGFTVAESLGRPSVGFSHPDDLQAAVNALLPVLQLEVDSTRVEIRFVTRSRASAGPKSGPPSCVTAAASPSAPPAPSTTFPRARKPSSR